MFSCLKNGLTFIKEQYGIIDLRLSKNELEILARCYSTQWWEIDQQNLINHIYLFAFQILYLIYRYLI